MKSLVKMLKRSLAITVVMLIVCGFAYPLALTGVSQVVFPKQANGNLIMVDGEAVGSELVGQQFTDERFLKGRVSAIGYNTYTEEDLVPDENGETAYGGVSSGSFNYGATNPDLKARVEADIATFLEANPTIKKEDIPADLLTASGSGLDPHISPKSAQIQLPAMAEASGLSVEELQQIVDNNTDQKVLGVYGEVRVNVLKTNIEIAEKLGILK